VSRLPRLLIVNDYSLAKSWRDAKEGFSPIHFLYGVDRLEEVGFELDIVSEEWSRWLAALDRKLHRIETFTGPIDRQVAAARYLNGVDAIYSPCQWQVQGFAHLRALGLLRVPVIMLGHHPLVRGRFPSLKRPLVRAMLRGVAAMPTLARAVADEANAIAGRSFARALPWGPDAPFYPPAIYPGTGILAAGRTGRDFSTFGKAATIAGAASTILTFRPSVTPDFASFGANVDVVVPEVFIPYSETTQMFSRARALAIPMFAQDGLCGLTSLMDALGAGKPVIMTRNALIDLDIEKAGIGRWVDAGDTNGWVEALRFFDENPRQAEEMGRRARALVDGGLTYRAFSDEIVALVRASIAAGR
jgi:hypothetical protein